MCISNYASINRKLSISEMAQIHDISRQTLIYYDKIDLFKPEIIDDKNGYRYYSTLQIPQLREICFLRSIGMPLDDIRKNNAYNNSESTIELLESQYDKLNAEIEKLAAPLLLRLLYYIGSFAMSRYPIYLSIIYATAQLQITDLQFHPSYQISHALTLLNLIQQHVIFHRKSSFMWTPHCLKPMGFLLHRPRNLHLHWLQSYFFSQCIIYI